MEGIAERFFIKNTPVTFSIEIDATNVGKLIEVSIE